MNLWQCHKEELTRFITGAAFLDFETGNFKLGTAKSEEIEVGPGLENPITLENMLEGDDGKPIFVIFGVEFFQEVNGNFYPMKNGAHNALRLIQSRVVGIVVSFDPTSPVLK